MIYIVFYLNIWHLIYINVIFCFMGYGGIILYMNLPCSKQREALLITLLIMYLFMFSC